ncbi:MAG: YihY/virulence factor BrkB family protein [Hormoscilla sp. GUM202]|nr:YihY/virulence factor BrkB family protein [Hormoscilla sp. GUM202]
MKLKAIVRLLKETVAEWQKDKVPILAAALAYYTVFSLAPLLILVIAIAGFAIGQEAAQERLVGEVQNLIGAEGAASIQNLIQNSYQPKSGILPSILAIATLLFGATSAFAQLKEALNIIWHVEPQQQRGGIIGFILTRVFSFLMVLSIGILLLLSLVLSAVLTGISNWLEHWLIIPAFVWQLGDLTISFGLVTLLFALIYRFLPDVKIAWSDVWIGSAITSLLFTLGKGAIALYLGRSTVGSAYGAAGSFVIILLWVFYSAQILLFGAEFTQVWANLYGSRIRYSSRRRKNAR